jgi:hypothetical protein
MPIKCQLHWEIISGGWVSDEVDSDVGSIFIVCYPSLSGSAFRNEVSEFARSSSRERIFGVASEHLMCFVC